MKQLLWLWPLAGFVFWAIFQAKWFRQYPFGVAGMLGICLAAGPLSWAVLLLDL